VSAKQLAQTVSPRVSCRVWSRLAHARASWPALIALTVSLCVAVPAGRADMRATEPAPAYVGPGSSPPDAEPVPVYDGGGSSGAVIIVIGGAVVCVALSGIVASRRRSRRRLAFARSSAGDGENR
jgi:hypothetical protein